MPNSRYRIFSDEADTSAEARELDRLEWQINRTCSVYLQKGAAIRCILALDEKGLRSRYSNRQVARRCTSLLRAVSDNQKLRVVLRAAPIERNVVIIGAQCILTSNKPSERSRLYDEVTLQTETESIPGKIEEFDHEFNQLEEDNVNQARDRGIAGRDKAETLRKYVMELVAELRQSVI